MGDLFLGRESSNGRCWLARCSLVAPFLCHLAPPPPSFGMGRWTTPCGKEASRLQRVGLATVGLAVEGQ